MSFKRLSMILRKNSAVMRDDASIIPAKENTVNLNGWFMPGKEYQNIGDMLSPIVVGHTAALRGIDPDRAVSGTKHLYAIGSILLGFQDATVWGSGFLHDITRSRFFKAYAFLHRHWHTTDIRAVRGPETRNTLLRMGLDCPEVYGDPAILMPRFYTPKMRPRIPYMVVPHYVDVAKFEDQKNVLYTFVRDYESFIDELCSAEVVYSSSLHGIILAEAYGIPAILLNEKGECPFKYRDYYYSTGRYDIPVCKSVEEALAATPLPVPDLEKMREELIRAFPADLWD